jgi:uncharacterized protein YbjT (DUF2867 family)
MTNTKTIVFGATGAVGSAAAINARKQGAEVFLALRDTAKPIPGLSAEQEKELGFTRVQADLTQPKTVAAAVAATGATRAFLYVVFGSPDHMRSTAATLKAGGIDFVVLLSSISIHMGVALADVPPTDVISWLHAQVELALDETFGPRGFVAVRPGYFASNAVWQRHMIAAGDVRTPLADATFDWIAPRDVGDVCGALLARGPELLFAAGQDRAIVRLAGPKLLSEKEGLVIIAAALGKEIKVTPVDVEEGVQMMSRDRGMAEPVVRYLISTMRDRIGNEAAGELLDGGPLSDAVENIRKYTGREPTTLQEWASENKEAFAA